MNLLEGADQLPDDRLELLNKWKDKPAEDVLKAKIEADLHIKSLEREKAELREMYLSQREELLAKAKFEEYIDQMRTPNNQNLQVANTPAKEVDSPKYDPAEIEKMFDRKLSDFEKLKQETENFSKVQTKLKERYGDSYVSVLKDQQSALGLSQDDVNALAKKSPEAFFRIMDLNEQQSSFQAPPRSGQRNDNFSPKGSPKRDWNYYQELKKTNPMMYLDPKISLQMEKDAQALGPAFGLPDD